MSKESKYEKIEKNVEKRLQQKDKKKRKRMKVSGKSVFTLKKLIQKRHDSLSKRRSNKKK